MEVSGQFHAPARFTLKTGALNTHYREEKVVSRVGLDAVQKRNISTPAENRTTTPWLSSL
jgi:hypothetical protein